MGEYQKVFTQASLMDIDPRAACRMRVRYLKEEVHCLIAVKPGHQMNPVAAVWINEAMDEIVWLNEQAYRRTAKRYTRVDHITDTDIEIAKQFPVAQLVEFKNFKATAWCHEDKKPSLWYANRINRVVCPVCDKKFNAIDICMERDGMSFIDAVKLLRGG